MQRHTHARSDCTTRNRRKAERLLAAGLIDAVAFGRAFIANPDLVTRLSQGLPLNAVQQATVYGGGAAGYTDYPRWSGAALAG